MSKSTETKLAVRSGSFYFGLATTFVVLLILYKFAPEATPFALFQFWFVKIDLSKLREIPWILLLVGPGLVLLRALLTKKEREQNIAILENTREGVTNSILAGIFEEISFRWLGFYLAIFSFWSVSEMAKGIWTSGWWLLITSNLWVSIPLIIIALVVINFAGFVGLGIIQTKEIKGCTINLLALLVSLFAFLVDVVVFLVVTWSWMTWTFDTLFIPLVNIITQGRLTELLNNYGWAVTAAVVSVNWKFGKGHGYQGWFGIVDAWVFGMIMFWLTFNFGLPVAIIAHIGYDVLLHIIVATDAVAELGKR